MSFKRVRCRYASCGAEIIWAISATTGKPAPLDAEPREDYGNIMLQDDGVYQVLEPEVAKDALARRFKLYTNHFATCPAIQQQRKAS